MLGDKTLGKGCFAGTQVAGERPNSLSATGAGGAKGLGFGNAFRMDDLLVHVANFFWRRKDFSETR